MKSFLSFTLAGIAGGLISFGAIHLSGKTFFPKQEIHTVSNAAAVTAGPDFADAAALAQKVVVLIEAEESVKAAKERRSQGEAS